MKGTLSLDDENDITLFAYQEAQDVDKEIKSTTRILEDSEETYIHKKSATYKMDKDSPTCVEIKEPLQILFDNYLKLKDSMQEEFKPRTIQGKECTCVGDEKAKLEYCESVDSNPCYFSFPSEKNQVTFITTSFGPIDAQDTPFVPDLYHYCPQLGLQNEKDVAFPEEFYGQIRKFSNNTMKFVTFGFSSKQKLFYFESDTRNLYNFETGTILNMDPFTDNLIVDPITAYTLKCADLSGDTYEPVIKYLELGPTAPGYYIDVSQGVRRYTTFLNNVLRNFYTVNTNNKEVFFRSTSYNAATKEFSVYDINYKEGSMMSQSFFENLDLEAAYLQNDMDKEIVIEFSSDRIINPTKEEEFNIRHEVSKQFDEYFKDSIDTRRVMGRRVEINYSRVYMYAKIANENLFHDAFLISRGEPKVPADIVNTAKDYGLCRAICAQKDCVLFHFHTKAVEKNCNLYNRYLNKIEVDHTSDDVLGSRLSRGSKMAIDDFKKNIDAKLISKTWQVDLKLVDGMHVSLSSMSKSKSFTNEEMKAMVNNFGVESLTLSLNSLQVSRDAILRGKYYEFGKTTLKDCIDSFIKIKKSVNMNAFMYNTDFYECTFILESDGDRVEVFGVDLYEYKPLRSFESIKYPLKSEGYIGQTESLSDCAGICLGNSTNFIKIDTTDARQTVPFERVCLGVQFLPTSKKCYLEFKAIEPESANLNTNEDHLSYMRKVQINFNSIVIFTAESITESFGALLPKAKVPMAKCIELYNLECAFLTICNKKGTKEIQYFASNADMNLANVLKPVTAENYDCMITQNNQDVPAMIIKDVIIKEEKYRSLSNGGVAGITIFLMIVGIVIGVFGGKALVR